MKQPLPIIALLALVVPCFGQSQVTVADKPAAGSITSTQSVMVSTQGASTVMLSVSGTGTGTLQPKISLDGVNWVNASVNPVGGGSAVSSITSVTSTPAFYTLPIGGIAWFEVVGNTWSGGTVSVVLNAGSGSYPVGGSGTASSVAVTSLPSLPSGSNIVGKFTTDQTTHGTTDLVASDTTKVGGTSVATGAGVVGTGTQRVAVGQDTTTIAGSAPGTAGTPSTNVITVQGTASMTPIQSSQSGTWTVQPGNTANTTPWLFNLGQWGGTNVVNGGVVGLPAAAGNVASGATDAGNPVKTGGVYNTTQPTVTNGQRVDTQSTAHGGTIVATGTDTFNVTVNAALPAGSNTIGALTANQSVNVSQVNGVAVSTGAGAVGTGTARIAVGADTATIAGSAPGTAGTPSTNVVSVQGVALGTALPTNQSQVSGTAVSVNNGTTDAGTTRVTLSSDSTGQVKLATGSNTIGALTANQSVNVAQVGGTNTVTAGVAGLQAVGGNAASASTDSGNPVKVGGVYNSSPPALTSGQRGDTQMDSAANIKIYLATLLAGEDLTNGVLGTIPKYVVASTYSPSTYESAASGSQVVQANIKNAAGVLASLSASNANAAIRYLWITNATTSPANALASSDASVIYIYAIMATSARDITIPAGKYFSAGISFGFSTSATSFTAGTAADHTLNANYF